MGPINHQTTGEKKVTQVENVRCGWCSQVNFNCQA